ncbi:hypothetical protein THAR02_07153 [Trichoderma harzianum]|uniref:Uncharacterized protein n=1 Tax=Trichoderma harzianum TaxID=5544 RepID=A0A0F9ZKB9_TRIHA|nr:hypothetical protein THAR02_07153 [Trichoderma harzianum]
MVAITKFLWLALAATAATAVAIVQRDVITVQNDIKQKIGPIWTTLKNDIDAFPNSGSLLVPTFLSALVTLVTQKPTWDNVPDRTPSILWRLQIAEIAMSKFLDAVVASEPTLLKPGGYALKAQLTGAFATAIAVYSV